MKKCLLLLAFTIISFISFGQSIRTTPSGYQFGQIGNGTTNNVFYSINGILYPRVGYAPSIWADTTTANASSLNIKNIPLIQIATADGKNWYRNIGLTAWVELGSGGGGSGTAWDILGNSGTVAGTNFLGTTDNKGVDVRTDSIIGWRFDSLQRLQVEQLTALNDTASDFEIILIPDTQNEVDNQDGTGQAAGRSIFQWISDNKITRNIKVVIGLGDITNLANAAQLDTADKWYDILDAANIPYVPTIGNHDYNSNLPATRNASNYLGTFGPSRLSGYSWYGGNYSPAQENFWVNLDIMGRQFSILSLEFFPRNAVLTWADSLLDANPTRNWIYVTHAYVNSFGERSKDTSLYGNSTYVIGGDLTPDNSGQEQWDSFVKKHKNISFVFNGHFASDGFTKVGYTRHFTDVGIEGNVIHQLFANWQVDTAGGNGFFVRLQFKPQENEVDVKYFSAYKNREDSRVESFTYEFPNVSVQSNVGVKGNLSVAGEARFDGVTTFQNLTKTRFPFIGENGSLRDTNSVFYNAANNSFQATKAVIGTYSLATTVPLFVSKVATFGSPPAGVVSGHTVPGFRNNIAVGAGGTFYVTHGSGNFGMVIQAARTDAGGANLSFFKTNTSDFSTLAAPGVGHTTGRIYWQAAGSDNSTIQSHVTLYDFIEGLTATYPYAGLAINTSGPTVGLNAPTFYLSGDGALRLGGSITPAASSVLDLQGTTRGFLPPRLTTTQRDAIGLPVPGLMIYNTTDSAFNYYRLSGWTAIGGSGSQTPWTSNINADGFTLYGNDGSGENLTLGSTSHGTKGKIDILDSVNFNGKTIENFSAKYNVQTGTTYTLVAADNGKILSFNNGSDITLTVPAGLPAGFTCTIIQLGAGEVIPTASSTTLNNRSSFTKTAGQYAVIGITMYTSDTFVWGGDGQ